MEKLCNLRTRPVRYCVTLALHWTPNHWVVASATSVVNCTGRVCIEHELLRVRCITTTMPASETSVVPLSRTTTALPVLPPPPQDVSERDQVNSATASGILI